MESVSLPLFFLTALLASNLVSRVLPRYVPLPFVQILLGMVIGIGHIGIPSIEPEVFMLLLVAPLLFLDGWRISNDQLIKNLWPILGLALGLVILTVVTVGLLVHWMIPALPLPVAFAFAAIVSPTDAVAISSIARRFSLGKRMRVILEGESLLNDASGLVCLKFAVAAAVTGMFSLPQAATAFAWMAGAGVFIGFTVAWSLITIKAYMAEHFGKDYPGDIIASIIIPFAAFLIADNLDASGVLAAVTAGITMTFAESVTERDAETHLRRRIVWDMLSFALNGTVFLLMGAQVMTIIGNMDDSLAEAGHITVWMMAGYVLAVVVTLGLLRWFWVVVSIRFTLLVSRLSKNRLVNPPSVQVGPAMAAAGARGAVTLAAAMSLPYHMPNGALFPGRDLIILMASAVIIISLMVTTVLLPYFLARLKVGSDETSLEELRNARIQAVTAAIGCVEQLLAEQVGSKAARAIREKVGQRLIEEYRGKLDYYNDEVPRPVGEATVRMEYEIRLAAVQAERAVVQKLLKERLISDEVADKMMRELDLLVVHIHRRQKVG